MNGHFITYGSCGHVIDQCRCIGLRTEKRVNYPCPRCLVLDDVVKADNNDYDWETE